MSRRRRDSRPGFTLIELAIIIAIIGILGAVGAVRFADMQTEAKAAGAKAALANARSALAVAIAKDTNGTVTYDEYKAFLEGASGTMSGSTFTVEGKYTITVDGDSTSIKSIRSAAAIE